VKVSKYTWLVFPRDLIKVVDEDKTPVHFVRNVGYELTEVSKGTLQVLLFVCNHPLSGGNLSPISPPPSARDRALTDTYGSKCIYLPGIRLLVNPFDLRLYWSEL